MSHDLDDHPRPIGESYDIGADEFPAALTATKQASTQLIQVGTPLTYTIRVTNTGHMDLHTIVTDILPAYAGSVHTWTPTIASAGGAWEGTVVLSIGTEHRGTLTNVVQVLTEEGPVATDTCSVIVADKLATVRPSESETIIATGDEGIKIRVKIPMGAVTETTQLAYTSTDSINDAPADLVFAGYAFRLAAYRNDARHTGLAFENPITVTIHYAALDTTGLDEDTLTLRYWNGHTWSPDGIAIVGRDTAANKLTATIAHLSDFAIFSEKQHSVYLPTVMHQYRHPLSLSSPRR